MLASLPHPTDGTDVIQINICKEKGIIANMTIKEAESIVRAYSAHFAELNDKKGIDKSPWVFSSFDLPWSPAKLKYAFFVFTEDLVKTGEIDERYDMIRVVYSSIDGTFKEEADKINEDLTKHFAYLDNLDKNDPSSKQKATIADIRFRAEHDGINPDLPDNNHAGEIEIHNFIVDIQGKYANK